MTTHVNIFVININNLYTYGRPVHVLRNHVMFVILHVGLLLNTSRGSDIGWTGSSAEQPGPLLREGHALRLGHVNVVRLLVVVSAIVGIIVILLHGPAAAAVRRHRRGDGRAGHESFLDGRSLNKRLKHDRKRTKL